MMLLKSIALATSLMLASPVLASPNETRELQLETEERLEQVSEESKSPAALLDIVEGVTITNHEFYGDGVVFPIATWKQDDVYYHRHGHHHHGGRIRGNSLIFQGNGVTIQLPLTVVEQHHFHPNNNNHRPHNHCAAGSRYRGCHTHHHHR